MKEKTMVFRAGTQDVIWGISLETAEIEASDVDEYVADGWYRHPFDVRDAGLKADQDAAQAKADKDAEEQRLLEDEKSKAEDLTKAELVAKAESLGVQVDGRWSVKSIQDAIDEVVGKQ